MLYVKDIIDNMERAENFIKDIGFAEFAKNEEKNYAVVRCIEIIGEASKNIPMSLEKK